MNTKKVTIHSIFLNQSDQHFLKDYLRDEIASNEQMLAWYNAQLTELWVKCDPSSKDYRSEISFHLLNLYKNNARTIIRQLKYLRRIQKQVKGSTRDTFDIMDTEE